ncbi:MAG TPA: lactate utilization protein [Planctomycetota bacterium]|nr:lactate utilization protein [Planctomycetota bacterium]
MTQALVDQFKKKYESLAGVVHPCADTAAALQAIAGVLKDVAAKRAALADLPADLHTALIAHCAAEKIEVLKQPYNAATLPGAIDHAEVGISGVAFAVAPMGAFIELTTDDAVRLVSTLPRTHIAVLGADTLLATLEEAAPLVKGYFQAHPKNAAVSFISGPSRSGDIEMRLTLGVHGPMASHVVVLPKLSAPVEVTA